jgi:hypothetical protein
MPKTKKNHKKHRTNKRRKFARGAGRPEELRNKTRTMRNTSPERRRTINPNDRNTFNRSNRTYVPAEINQDLRFIATPPKSTTRKSPPKFRDNGLMVDNKFGPNEEGFYRGPSVIRDKKGIPHGKDGIILYSTGHIYQGDFNKGKREGTGRFIVNDGPKYEGEWKDDKFVPFIEYKSQNK